MGSRRNSVSDTQPPKLGSRNSASETRLPKLGSQDSASERNFKDVECSHTPELPGKNAAKSALSAVAVEQASAPTMPAQALRRRIRLEVPKNGRAGFVWGDGGLVTKVAVGGAAEAAGVRTCPCPKKNWLDAPCGCPDAWRIVGVQGASVAPLNSAKFIGDLLVAAREGGQPYYLIFEAGPGSAQLEDGEARPASELEAP